MCGCYQAPPPPPPVQQAAEAETVAETVSDAQSEPVGAE